MQPTLREKPFSANDYGVEMAIRQIEGDYGVKVSVVDKRKQLTKFGRNEEVGTSGATVMTLPSGVTSESYVNRNLITHFASSSTADAMILTVEGHTVGSTVSVSSLTQTAGTATCTTGSAHGHATGDWVYIEGANEAGYNGIVQVTVSSTTVFTYTVASGTASPATGTITSTNQNKTFTVQSATLAGQTKTALSTPLARCTRAYVKEQNKATDLVGTVYFSQDVSYSAGVPGTASAVHLMIPAGFNQSEKASTSLSSQDYWIVTDLEGSINEKTGTVLADLELQVRKVGGVFRPIARFTCTNLNSRNKAFIPPRIVPANADVRIRAIASSANTEVIGVMSGHLAIAQ